MRFEILVIASLTLSGISAVPTGRLQKRCSGWNAINPACWISKGVQQGVEKGRDEVVAVARPVVDQVNEGLAQANELKSQLETYKQQAEGELKNIQEILQIAKDRDEKQLFLMFEDRSKIRTINGICNNQMINQIDPQVKVYCRKWRIIRNKMVRVVNLAKRRPAMYAKLDAEFMAQLKRQPQLVTA